LFLSLLGLVIPAPVWRLAHVIEGEAGVCGHDAKLAIARITQVNPRMNGWATPTADSLLAALTWRSEPDPVPGARYVFSAQDRQNPAVKEITAQTPLLRVFRCRSGLSLWVYGAER
jgi:hypothetical protein